MKDPALGSAPKTHSGLILLDKPAGITSFSALGGVKRKLGTPKVGHTGTLDKFASGLLLVLTGKFTKLNPFFTNLDKEYEAEFLFGRETDTLDPEGEVVMECPPPDPKTVEKILGQFTGELRQIPPAYSAVHIDGERASKMARAGLAVDMPSRTINIYAMDILMQDASRVALRISCSKGTYIRSLARDLGRAAGSCAYVTRLIRTKVGGFELRNAVAEPDFYPEKNILTIGEFLPSLPRIGAITAVSTAVERINQGAPLYPTFFTPPPPENGVYAVFTDTKEFLALIEKKMGSFSYIFSGAGV